MARRRIAHEDHDLRFSGQIYTVTVESIAAFVKQQDKQARNLALRLEQ